jgi:hypothetical protein
MATKKSANIRDTKISNQLGKEKVGDKLGKNKPQTLTRTATAVRANQGLRGGMRQRRVRMTRSS